MSTDKQRVKEFIEYVESFYCKGNIYAHFFGDGMTKKQAKFVALAIVKYSSIYTDGDSTDRECARDLGLKCFVKDYPPTNYDGVGLEWESIIDVIMSKGAFKKELREFKKK